MYVLCLKGEYEGEIICGFPYLQNKHYSFQKLSSESMLLISIGLVSTVSCSDSFVFGGILSHERVSALEDSVLWSDTFTFIDAQTLSLTVKTRHDCVYRLYSKKSEKAKSFREAPGIVSFTFALWPGQGALY